MKLNIVLVMQLLYYLWLDFRIWFILMIERLSFESTINIQIKLIAQAFKSNILDKLCKIVESFSSHLERASFVALQGSKIKISKLVDICLENIIAK